MHDVCYDTHNTENLYSNTSGSLLSQYIYEKNISFHTPVAYPLFQLEMTPGNKVCCHPLKFCIIADPTIVVLLLHSALLDTDIAMLLDQVWMSRNFYTIYSSTMSRKYAHLIIFTCILRNINVKLLLNYYYYSSTKESNRSVMDPSKGILACLIFRFPGSKEKF